MHCRGILVGYQVAKPQAPLGQPLTVYYLGNDLVLKTKRQSTLSAPAQDSWHSRLAQSELAGLLGETELVSPKINLQEKNIWRLMISYLDKSQLLILKNLIEAENTVGVFELHPHSLCS